MTRNVYLGMLAVLQAAMMWQVLPAVVGMLQRNLPLGTAVDFWTSSVQLGAALTCIVASALVLAFPTIALVRHCEHGPVRYLLLPQWAVGTAVAGAAMFVAALLPRAFGEAISADPSRAIAAPLLLTGFSMMHAGALAAEVLRRNPYVRRSDMETTDTSVEPVRGRAWQRAA